MTLTPSSILKSKITVVGAARSGIAAARLLASKGARVFLTEVSPREEIALADTLEGEGIALEFGGHTDRAFDAGVIVVSPGVPSDSPILLEATKRGIPIMSELELASLFCPAPKFAVSGTNGKTTTTMLLGEILRNTGKNIVVAGNIGYAFSDAVRETSGDIDAAVLEVSSYQLDHCVSFHPKVAVITTITPDHLDRYHGSFEQYVASKQRLFMNQTPKDALIYNADNDATVSAVQSAPSRSYPVSIETAPGKGAWLEGKHIVLHDGGKKHQLVSVDELLLRGAHNHMNVMMASLAAFLHGVKVDVIRETVLSFKGVEHRLEFVRELDGVTWINDSKATNVDSVLIALRSIDRPAVLIAGGRDKGAPYDPLFDAIGECVRAAVLIGEAADRMEKAFEPFTNVHRASSLFDAVQTARALARTGDTVLLSPACSSFDMFENYEHRGQEFKLYVNQLRAQSS